MPSSEGACRCDVIWYLRQLQPGESSCCWKHTSKEQRGPEEAPYSVPFQCKGARKQQNRQEGCQQQRWVYVLQRQTQHLDTFLYGNSQCRSICSGLLSALIVRIPSVHFSTLHHTGTVYASVQFSRTSFSLLPAQLCSCIWDCRFGMESTVARHEQLTSQARVPAPTSSQLSAKD